MKNTQKAWLFYVASAPQFGGGHVMRSLELAKTMQANGKDIDFLLDQHAAHWCPVMSEHGFKYFDDVNSVKDEYEGLWLDHYHPDYMFLNRCSYPVAGLIDTVNKSGFPKHSIAYSAHVGANVSGFEYALLNPEFAKIERSPSPVLSRITLCFGQKDSKGATTKILSILESTEVTLKLNVVCGAQNEAYTAIKEYVDRTRHDAQFYHAPSNLIEIMAQTDLFIGSGGVSVLESCAAGIPYLAIITAENQSAQVEELSALGVIINAGKIEHIIDTEFLNLIDTLTPMALNQLSNCSRKLIDGNGAQRIANEITTWAKNANG